MIILLFIFYHFDMKAYRKDIAAGLKPDINKPGTEGEDPRRPQPDLYHYDRDRRYLKRYPAVHADVSGCRRKCPRIHVFGEVTLSYPAIIECVIILVSAFLSFKTTDGSIRRENHFTWGAIHEVAVLFRRYLYYDAAGTYDLKGKRSGAWDYRAV